MNTIVITCAVLWMSINLVSTQQQHSSVSCTQLYSSVDQLCSGNVNDLAPITSGVPGKRGPKGDKGDSSTYEENEEKDRRVAAKLASLHEQLTAVEDENQRLKEELNTKEQQLNNKITGVEDKMQRMLSRDDNRLKLCGLLQLPSKIKDSQLTSSSYLRNNVNYAAPHGRLFSTSGFGGCWHAANNQANEWIQVDLEQNEKIYGVVTQGRQRNANQWMTSYGVSYKIDGGGNFRYVVDESGASVVFQGNVDTQTPVINNFHAPITARYFRVHKLTTNVAYICIRIDLLAC